MRDPGRPNGLILLAVVAAGLVAFGFVFAAGSPTSTTTIAPRPLAAPASTSVDPEPAPTSTVFPPPTTTITFFAPATPVDAAPGWRAIPGGPGDQRFGATALWTEDGLLLWGGGPVDTEVNANAVIYRPSIVGNPWQELPAAPITGGEGALLVESSNGVLALWKGAAARYSSSTERWVRLEESPLVHPIAGAWTGVETIVIGNEQRAPGSARLAAIAFGPDGGCCRFMPQPPIDLTKGWAFWTGDRLLLIGGRFDVSTNLPLDDRPSFVSYDPAMDEWTVLPSPDLEGVEAMAAAWNGTELIVWDYLTKAAAWHPDRRWRTLPDLPFDNPECPPESSAANGKVFAFSCGNAAFFDPAADRWVRMWLPPWDSLTAGSCTPVGTVNETTDVYMWCAPPPGGEPQLWAVDLDAVETTAVSRPASASSWELVPHPEWSDRDWASLVWSGTELIVWGGSDGATEVTDGWAYAPDSGMMHRIPDSGRTGGRVGQSAVWTGEVMAVWRGTVSTWDPNRIEWVGGQRAAGPPLHAGNTALWTGDEILFWGTRNWFGSSERGAGFDLNEWRELPPSALEARSDAVVVWSGDGRYVWADDAMYVWGGSVTGGPTGIQAAQDGAAYSPVDDAWRLLPPLPDGVHLERPVGGFVAGELIVVGVDRRRNGGDPVVAGVAYDPRSDTWKTIADLPGPIVDDEGLAGSLSGVAAGDRFALWLPHRFFGDAAGLAFYDPAADAWTSHHGAPADAYGPQLVWTGDRVAVLAPAGLVLFTP